MRLSIHYWLNRLLAALVIVMATTAAQAEPGNETSLDSLELVNGQHPAPNIITGGQPTPEQLHAMQKAGVKHVINLRTDGEQDWDEAALVKSLGMQYHAIPVAGAAGVNKDNAAALNALLQSLGDDPVVLHCASGNRVGALVALSAAEDGATVDAAIAKGKNWGMTRLEGLVREKLNTQIRSCCADTDAANEKP